MRFDLSAYTRSMSSCSDLCLSLMRRVLSAFCFRLLFLRSSSVRLWMLDFFFWVASCIDEDRGSVDFVVGEHVSSPDVKFDWLCEEGFFPDLRPVEEDPAFKGSCPFSLGGISLHQKPEPQPNRMAWNRKWARGLICKGWSFHGYSHLVDEIYSKRDGEEAWGWSYSGSTVRQCSSFLGPPTAVWKKFLLSSTCFPVTISASEIPSLEEKENKLSKWQDKKFLDWKWLSSWNWNFVEEKGEPWWMHLIWIPTVLTIPTYNFCAYSVIPFQVEVRENVPVPEILLLLGRFGGQTLHYTKRNNFHIAEDCVD